MILVWPKYNSFGNIRVHRNGIVERKYKRKGEWFIWKQVDCFTLCCTPAPNRCKRAYLRRLLRTAF